MNNPTQYRTGIPGRRGGTGVAALVFVLLLVPSLLATRSALAQSYGEIVLHTFSSQPDGENPSAGLVRDAQGNLYGTTGYGGHGLGTVFETDANGNETVLYSFTGTGGDGAYPWPGLLRDSQGNLYGTTEAGGNSACFYGCGTVFKLDMNGKETVLYSFSGGADGANPDAGLVQDAQGNLYGTTVGGGSFGDGTVFMVDTNNKETVLHSFSGGADGLNPHASLARDTQGNLYGTTPVGGAFGVGTVFKVDAKGQEMVLHSFSGTGGDGASPDSSLVLDTKGNLYGTTPSGGTSGRGTVFKVDTTGKETVVYSFGLADGYPVAGLVLDAHGNLYGTTYTGGNPACQDGCGSAFRVSVNGKKTALYSFPGGAGGLQPSNLVRDERGNLYGTTYLGGDLACNPGLPGCGVVFKLAALTSTKTALSSSPNPSTYGQAVVFSATVNSKAGAPPDGETVSFMKGKTVLGTGTLSGGSATFTTSTLKVGTTTVTAAYGGDPNFAASKSKPVKQVVKKAVE